MEQLSQASNNKAASALWNEVTIRKPKANSNITVATNNSPPVVNSASSSAVLNSSNNVA